MYKRFERKLWFLKDTMLLVMVLAFLFSTVFMSSCKKEDKEEVKVEDAGPTGFSATAGYSQNILSWPAVSGATSYNIYWSNTSGVTKANGTKITGVTSPYTHSNLIIGTKYYYIVTVVNSNGESAASSQASATPDTSNIWAVKSAMLTARSMLTAGVVNGKIYVMGGTTNDIDNGTIATVEEYDTATGSWTTKALMPGGRRLSTSATVNGKIYLIGGDPGSMVIEYDPATNSWATKASMTLPRNNLSSAVANGKIYVIGGCCSANTVEEYDPATDLWVTKASMPTAREGLTCIAVNGEIYAIGGASRSGNNTFTFLGMVEKYDPVNNLWTTKSPMPTLRGEGLTSAVVNGKIYVIGGFNGSALSVVEEYDPITDTWVTKASMPTARYHITSGVVAGKIYVIGGSSGSTTLSTVEVYTP